MMLFALSSVTVVFEDFLFFVICCCFLFLKYFHLKDLAVLGPVLAPWKM